MTRRNIALYVAGPIQGRDLLHSLANIEHGQEQLARLFQLGFSPFPVFCDSTFVQRIRPLPKIEDVYAYSIEWLRRADAMFCLPGWEHSAGCKAELDTAKTLSIPVFFDVADLCAWADHDKVTK